MILSKGALLSVWAAWIVLVIAVGFGCLQLLQFSPVISVCIAAAVSFTLWMSVDESLYPPHSPAHEDRASQQRIARDRVCRALLVTLCGVIGIVVIQAWALPAVMKSRVQEAGEEEEDAAIEREMIQTGSVPGYLDNYQTFLEDDTLPQPVEIAATNVAPAPEDAPV